MLKQLRTGAVLFVFFTLLTGVLYPALVIALAQGIFPAQANGSLVARDGQVVGSALIGQSFEQAGYFWGRLSATPGHPYNAAASGGSNLGPLNPARQQQAEQRAAALRALDPENEQPIPVDLLTASGSGLDAHISPAAARYQAARVARARGLALEQVEALIAQHSSPRTFGLLGEARVNVFLLNLALDEIQPLTIPETR